ERVVGAAELECAGALQVLALEEETRAGFGVEGSRARDQGPMRNAFDLGCGAFDVGERRQRHFSLPSSSSYTFRIAMGPCEDESVQDAYSPKLACLIAWSTGTPASCRRLASAMTACSAR